MTVTVKWIASNGWRDPVGGIVAEFAILDDWAAIPSFAEDAVNEVVEAYFASDEWFETFGDDDGAEIVVDVIEPAAIAGRYCVSLERVTRALSRRVETAEIDK